MSKILIILNDPPYGTERSYNGLRLAGSLSKRDGEQVRVFLIGDAASCAQAGQKTPKGFYNIESMLRLIIGRAGVIGVCGSCMDVRGVDEANLVEGCQRSSMEDLTDWTQWADRIAVF